jgi:hypothetical protein
MVVLFSSVLMNWVEVYVSILAVFPGFNFLLSALIFSKTKAKDFFPGPALASKTSLFLLFKFGKCSAISRVVVVLVTIATLYILDPLLFLEDLPTLLVTETLFLLPNGNEEGLGLLVCLIFSKFYKCLQEETNSS